MKAIGDQDRRAQAICLPAFQYLPSNTGDMTSPSPLLVKPSPAAPSAGKSRVGCRSSPLRSRIVLSYCALLNRRTITRPGSPARAENFGVQQPPGPAEQLIALLGSRLRRILGRHLAAFQHLQQVAPDFDFAPGVVERRETLEVQISLLLCRRMAILAVFLHQGPDPLDVAGGQVGRNRLGRFGHGLGRRGRFRP